VRACVHACVRLCMRACVCMPLPFPAPLHLSSPWPLCCPENHLRAVRDMQTDHPPELWELLGIVQHVCSFCSFVCLCFCVVNVCLFVCVCVCCLFLDFGIFGLAFKNKRSSELNVNYQCELISTVHGG
jgi:hypothetical protein